MSRHLDAKDFVDRARARSTAAAGARVISLDEVRAAAVAAGPRWRLDDLTGRLAELSGQGAVASLTAAAALVLEVQARREPCAWIATPGSSTSSAKPYPAMVPYAARRPRQPAEARRKSTPAARTHVA